MAKSLFTKFGNPAPATQQVIKVKDGLLFTSYGTPIAHKADDGTITLYSAWDASNTTTFYRNQFLGENTDATRKKIAKGEYMLSN